MSGLPIDIHSLSKDERLRLLEELWDSFEPEDLPLPDSQASELDRRVREADGDGWSGIPWEEVLSKLQSRR